MEIETRSQIVKTEVSDSLQTTAVSTLSHCTAAQNRVLSYFTTFDINRRNCINI